MLRKKDFKEIEKIERYSQKKVYTGIARARLCVCVYVWCICVCVIDEYIYKN